MGMDKNSALTRWHAIVADLSVDVVELDKKNLVASITHPRRAPTFFRVGCSSENPTPRYHLLVDIAGTVGDVSACDDDLIRSLIGKPTPEGMGDKWIAEIPRIERWPKSSRGGELI